MSVLPIVGESTMSRTRVFALLLLPLLLVVGLLGASVVRNLGLFGTYTSEELRERLRTANEEGRYHAALVLGARRDRDGVPALIEALRQDPSGRVRARAAFVLGELGDARAAGPLAESLAVAHADLQANAAWALGALKAHDAVPALEGLLGHADPRVRWNAAASAAELGSRRAAPVLLEMAAGPDPQAARAGVRLLGAVGEPADAATLQGLSDRGWGSDWTHEVSVAVRAIGERSGGQR